ncbi:hypothetical protein FHS51_001370 [Sphingobium wenxiniae]|jgi:hypothetical protein|uniref:Uncharacterized protein n=2 Tax=Sphingobium TaxID=165695 RepID=T0FZT8_9SPHN|nr:MULTISPECIES: hypothetical protein [Sphingobium]EQA96890.1 hypothetical protein L485_22685 [Sphingobium baderi LL03]KMS64083.1 hypothetical protein V475_20115 [Sphingobium baderi LL03]MBB6191148.1 hypothetical protein [Sphingobium wenxiniae]TWH96052.1 hypothetical protein IQ35_01141 [Sphingobium wenxiniae]WRD77925.1 hypothetical protein QQ987_07450 [Sphingobium baderi]
MDKAAYLKRRRATELNHAHVATCPRKRNQHEEQARAYGKIIDVLSREQQDAARGR